MNKSTSRGKVVKQNINGTIFDVRQVPKISEDNKTGVKTITSSSYALFIGKNNVKTGFKSVFEAGSFAVDNIKKYNKKTKRFV